MALSRKARDDGDGEFFDPENPVFTGKTKDGKEVVFSLDFDAASVLLSDEKKQQQAEFEEKINENYTIKMDEE